MGYTSRSMASGIQTGLVSLLSALIGVYLLAWVIDLLAPTFDSQKNFVRSLQLAVYSYTPQWVAGILLLFGTGLSMLVSIIGAVFAIYLMAIVAMIVIGIVVAMIIAAVLGLFFVSRAGGFGF
jgi:hypothetical protein